MVSPLRSGPRATDRKNWLATIASLAMGSAFFALWFWLLPFWLGFRIDKADAAGWRWIAALPSILGFAVASRCVWDFGRTGHGTPAPMIPPKKLVVAGFYRYVRNPMYLGFITGWIGLWIVFGQANVVAILIAFAVVVAVALFVVLYEEPSLLRKFGAEYEDYCRNVPPGYLVYVLGIHGERSSRSSRSSRTAELGKPTRSGASNRLRPATASQHFNR